MSHKSALIEVVNYKYDFDPNFDVDDNEAVMEMVKSKSCLLYTSPSPRDS